MASMSATKPHVAVSYRFKDITTIPDAKDMVDIVLSQTQRRTPTQVHPQFKISRIRSFYMRKVKYCQQTFHDKFSSILTEFPRLDDIHPFYADLCNVLYDKDHYKLALGQVNAVRGIVDHIAKDYVRLLKYADSPYKCKMLKRAALGRMCTAVRKLGDSLKYLEEVRQHLSRLPSINPSTRTLILTGYPNVGKSSFINAVTQANVEVQPYAFTTKSIFVGHFDFSYTRWQVIDTPGILDHPLANRNTIELTAITALAHIQATVLFFVDISEQCGFSIESQVGLFHSIKVLFKSKPLVIVLNKVDVIRFESLDAEKQALIRGMPEGLQDVTVLEMSCLTSEGIDAVKNKVKKKGVQYGCEMLLTRRVESKVASNRTEAIANRLHVTSVEPPKSRPPHIPQSVLHTWNAKDSTPKGEEETPRFLRDIEEENGGAGVYSIDLNSEWKLKNPNWQYDIMPEIYQGKNIYDFIDPDIDAKLEALEKEEAALLSFSVEKADPEKEEEWNETSKMLRKLHKKIELKRIENRLRENHAHRIMPMTSKPPSSLADVTTKLSRLGYHVEDGLSAPHARRHKQLTDSLEHDNGLSDDSGAMSDDDSLAASDDHASASLATASEVEDCDIEGDMTMRRKPQSTKIAQGKRAGGLVKRTTRDDPKELIQKRLKKFAFARTKCLRASSRLAEITRRARSSVIHNRITQGCPNPEILKRAEQMKRKREAGLKRMVSQEGLGCQKRQTGGTTITGSKVLIGCLQLGFFTLLCVYVYAQRKAGDSDRFIGTMKPRHLFSGKRGIGKTDRR